MTRFLLTVTLLFLFAASARALQWPWPIGWIGDDNEGVQQPRNRRGVVERSEDEWGTGSMDRQGWTPSWMQERTPWWVFSGRGEGMRSQPDDRCFFPPGPKC